MKETLEEMVTRIKAELKREKAKREESEYRHALICEALENLLDGNPFMTLEWAGLRMAGRKVLNGIADDN
ncbi:MAG TPA: hypothetical protein VI423_03080 [Paenisporosarcina sp.]|nr:hypothetical protein [Paenisporosarcina sp.]